MRMTDRMVAVVDVGTAKVLCTLAQYDSVTQKMAVISVGHQAARGMKKGQIVDLESIETSILHAVHSAEEAAGERIGRVIVNLSGAHVLSEWVEVTIPTIGRSIGDEDLLRLTRLNRSEDEEAYHVIHALPLSYSVGEQKGIEDPRGMYGPSLKAHMHVITATASPMRNLMTAFRRCHLDVDQVVATGVAAGYGTLVADEMDLGVCVVDMGAGVTDLAVFHQGKCLYVDVVPVGGQHMTHDIAQAFSLSVAEAERLKILYGSGIQVPADRKEVIPVPRRDADDRPITLSKPEFLDVLQARVEEVLELVQHRLQQKGLSDLVNRRFVLTGGVAQMPGIREFASRIWQGQVRIGRPLGCEGALEGIKSTAFATCAGLMRMRLFHDPLPLEPRKGVWRRVGSWISENF